MLSIGRQSGRLADVLVAGPGTFLDELLMRLGGANAFADAPARYPQVSLEEVVARAPDVILELRAEPVPADVAAALVSDWRQLSQVRAVRDGRVAVLAGDYVVTPGPRLPRLYAELRAVLESAERRSHPRPLSHLPPAPPPGEGRQEARAPVLFSPLPGGREGVWERGRG